MWKKIKKFFYKMDLKYRGLLVLTFLALMLYGANQVTNHFNPLPEEVSFTEFMNQVEDGQVSEVSFNPKDTQISYEDAEGKEYFTDNPKSDNFKRELLDANVKVVEEEDSTSFFDFAALGVQLAMLAFFARFLFKQSSTNTPEPMPSGIPGVNFETVAGNEEAKEEMQVLVDFLKNPDKYKGKGATLPKGAIFYGPPGTGKTLMARAVAGEAGVPFLSISGSDFTELYVGSGARRVRSLFKQARKSSPSIIFIDEIDAVGSSRSGETNSEYKQTINALLSEMDGFNKEESVIVIAATNRLEDLDSALVRPGRFDKQVAIGIPDRKDRLAILQVHAKNKKIADDVDLEHWAKATVGFAGADIASMMNEATILSVVDGREEITHDDLDNAHYKMVMKGNKKKNQEDRNEKELEIVAWHEAGHALLAKKLAKQSVPKVSILSSTSGAGGVTFITPSDNNLPSKQDLEHRIITLYGGRIAEHLLLKDKDQITAGASQDIKEATRLIRLMLTEWGMTEGYGMINPTILYGKADASPYLLEEAKRVSQDLYDKATAYLTEHVDDLEAIAVALLDKESIDEVELEDILNKELVA